MGGMFYITVEHDDWCLVWTLRDPSTCNCQPNIKYTEVTDDNLDEVAKLAEDNEERTRQMLRGKNN